MKAAMAPLALLSLIGGVVLIPGVSTTLEKFLSPTFEDSRYAHEFIPAASSEWTLAIVGGVLSLSGIALAYVVYMRRPGLTARLVARAPRLHNFLVNKWYWDELYDFLVVRPVVGFGRFGRDVIESAFVQETLIGGAVGVVRAGTSLARSVQSGYLRLYALMLVVGMFGLALYFLIVSS
jgi:NADH-quinone oxidoreductase subunit L